MDERTRILITRLSHIGDCVLTLPMVNRIKDCFPESSISWAIESPTHKLLANHPAIDDFLVIPKSWMKSVANWRSLRRQLQQRAFDVVIDPQGITKSAMLGWLSGAPVRIGANGKWGRELSPWLNNRLLEPKQTHLADRSVELLSALADALDVKWSTKSQHALRYDFPVPPSAVESVDEMMVRESLIEFAVINPGASWPSKRWSNERFGSVGSWLYRHHGLRSVITWAGEEEHQMALEIERFDPAAFSIAPATDLPQLAATLRCAKLFIGCDTGPLHIAAAVGTPCVGLYGTTQARDSGAWPFAEPTPHVAVQKWHQSGSCRKRRSAANYAMMDIVADDVFSACEKVLNGLHRKSA